MSELKLSILGSGSALPRGDAFHTSQVLEMRNKQFMIDCGEGAQIRMRQNCVHTARLNHIFISHLHGDHCFGLIGLISTLGMLGRTADITIHSHPDLESLLAPQVKYFCSEFPFEVKFEPFSPYKSEVIYDDKSVKITTLPLKHRVPSSGFLFEEKPTERHLVKMMLDAYEVPMFQYRAIKAGAVFVTPDGKNEMTRQYSYKDIKDLPNHIFDELRHFLTVYKQLENKVVQVQELGGAEEAKKCIEYAMTLFETTFDK